MTDNRYGNADTTKGMYHADIMNLYGEGMREALRVLKMGGYLWVKTKDQVMSARQWWSHIEIYNTAMEIGFVAQDLFILVPDSKTSSKRWEKQYHARKNHS
jgi:hypothetical protein